MFFVEGPRFLHRALDAGWPIEYGIVSEDLLPPGPRRVVERLRASGVPVLRASARVFRGLSLAADPTGISVVVRQRWLPPKSAEPGLWVAAAGIGTPGNLGTIIRTAEAAGASGVWLSPGTVDPFDPACVRASMGSVFGPPLVRGTWRELVGFCRRTNARLVGSSPRARRSYREVDLSGRVVIACGSEQRGLDEHQLRTCDEIVSIPMAATIDSLNVAVAAGIMLFEALHQRTSPRQQALKNRHEVALGRPGSGR